MKLLFRTHWSRYTDEEFIDKLRRSQDRWDRYWPWLLVLNAISITLIGWIWTKIIDVLWNVVQQPNVPFAIAGFVMGFALSLGFGWMILGPIHSIVSSIGMARQVRLLIKYHDALRLIAKRERVEDGDERLPEDLEE